VQDARNTLYVSRVAQLRALRSPVRPQLLRVLQRLGEATVSDLAQVLGRSAESLHYHVRALVRADFLEPVGERAGPGRAATVYRAVKRYVRIDPEQRSPAFLDAVGGLYGAALRRAERELTRGVRADHGRPLGEDRVTGLLQLEIRLTPAGRKRLRRLMEGWTEELERLDDPKGELTTVTACYAPLGRGEAGDQA